MGGQRIQDLVNKAEAAKDDSSVTSARVVFSDETAAQTAFNEYCRNLTDIGQWKESSTPSSYEAFDGRGEVVSNEPLAVGRFIRIAIAGSGKYDWVRVVSIDRYADEMILSVSPTFDPTEKPQKTDVISHFFAPQATNNFCLQRSGRYVSMWVIGLDEHQNTENTHGLVETARNVGVANMGSYLGIQKSVWKEFCTNFLSGNGNAQADE